MPKPAVVSLQLSRNSVGQLLDGLEVLAEDWEATAQWFDEESVADDAIIRECRDAEEANAIATCYRRLIGEIIAQLPAN